MNNLKNFFLFLISHFTLILTISASNLGLNYGILGNNLPSPTSVINLYKSIGITKLRIFDPNPDILNALRGNTDLQVTLGIKNQDLPSLAASQAAVNTWFTTSIEPHLSSVSISTISVGNEVIPGELSGYVLPVIQSLTNLVKSRNLSIFVSTTVAMTNLNQSFPPSAGVFTPESREQLVPVLKFLYETKTPILVNIYPYFSYVSDPTNIRLDYATSSTDQVVVHDGSFGYTNLFDSMFDAFVWAMEKEGLKDLPMIVSETGWPSAGKGNFTTADLAATYNGNFVKHVVSGKGTPKRPNNGVNGFLFATFNENQKPVGEEQNFGLYYPENMSPVYKLF